MTAPGPKSQSEFESRLVSDVREAVVALFRAYNVELRPAPLQSYGSGDGFAYLAAVRFNGIGVSGTLVLGASDRALVRSNPCTTSGRDWTGELANQLFGRVKTRHLHRGCELWSVAPTVIDGRHLLPVLTEPGFTPLLFRTPDDDPITVWLEIEVTGAVQEGEVADQDEIPSEGDLILF